jgi:hypothetical protein
MSTTRAQRGPHAALVVFVILLVEAASIAHPPAVGARYSATASGPGTARAATEPPTPAPTVVSSSVQGVTCVVQLSWSGPPTGEQYAIQRINGATTTVVALGTVAGTTTDSILVSALVGPPHYTTQAIWTADPLWTSTSPPATASGC